jgi:hypothetical protein
MRELVNIPLLQMLTLVAFSGTEKLPKGWSVQSCPTVRVSFIVTDSLCDVGIECMERERERHTERERDRETDTQRERKTGRDRERERSIYRLIGSSLMIVPF